MATKVIEKMKVCNSCGKTTLQRKNSKEMSWLLHLFLLFITAGGWLVIWFIMFVWHTVSKSATAVTSSWLCSECATKKMESTLDTTFSESELLDNASSRNSPVYSKGSQFGRYSFSILVIAGTLFFFQEFFNKNSTPLVIDKNEQRSELLINPLKVKYDNISKNCYKNQGKLTGNGLISVCAGVVSEKVKKDMNRRYVDIFKVLSKRANEYDVKELEKSQRSWLKYRNTHCAIEGNNIGMPLHAICPLELNKLRVYELDTLYKEMYK